MRFELVSGMLGITQKFQHAGVIVCRPGVLLPFRDKSFQRGGMYNYALSYIATNDILIL